MLGFTTSGIDIIMPDNYNLLGTPAIILTPNFPINMRVQTSNPLAGDGSIVVYAITTTLNI
jgi:hypothetical protein